MFEKYGEIQKQFDKVIAHSQNLNAYDIHTDELFERWYSAKRFFIDKFGDLIWESPDIVSFPLDEKDRDTKIRQFVDNTVLYRYNNFELARFIDYEKDGFFDNTVPIEYRTESGTIVPKGMKLVKAFKYFEKDEIILDCLQTAASILIQENKIEGKFCMSVHPLDFISCSENQYNWHSCHALDGEYRAGNLSYMVDKTTIICYIKGENDVILPNFPQSVPWNNKKWRMWLYLADEHNALMAGRQYPFAIGNVLNYVKNMIFDLCGYHYYNWSQWHHDIIRDYRYTDGTDEVVRCNDLLVIGGKFIPRTELVTDNSNLHYDDLLHSSYYTPYYCYRTTTRESIHFSVGGEVKCLCCGRYNIDNHETMVCNSCDDTDNYDYCTNCGHRHHVDDMHWVGDDHLCQDCFDDLCVYCYNCGEPIYRDDAIYDEDSCEWYCSYCYNNEL